MLLPESPLQIPEPVSSPGSMMIEPDGNFTWLKCRSPGEAYLIAQELEAADILVALPEAKVITDEFHSKGFVSLRVSTRAYEAATEVQRRIDRRLWETERSRQPLAFPMIAGAVALGLMPCFGLLLLPLIKNSLKEKAYERKAVLFERWFCVGFGFFLVLAAVVYVVSRVNPASLPIKLP
jgi:hypothetical protein